MQCNAPNRKALYGENANALASSLLHPWGGEGRMKEETAQTSFLYRHPSSPLSKPFQKVLYIRNQS